MSKFLEGLNPLQRKAVTHETDPLLIIAGPGSGKTRTVVHSIAYAIENGVQPDRILAFSFTGKACEDLKKQVKEIIVDEEKANLVQISTFHSFCRRVLREDIEKLRKGYTWNFKELKSADQKRVVNEQIAKVRAQITHLQHHKFLDPNDILDFITRCKLQFITPSVASEHVPHPEMPPEISRAYVKIYERYEWVLETNGWIDYANQLLLANELLRDVHDVKTKWQEKFELIFVDEYQDTDPVQYCIVTILAEKHQNVRVVGDDDQGIYGWRGADIQNILNFEKNYPKAKVISLGQNYRSTQRIVDASRALAEFNPDRRKKELFTQNLKGENVKHLHCKNAEEEVTTITSFVIRAIRYGWSFKDFAILCRLNSQVDEFKTAFNSLGIPLCVDDVSVMTIHGAKGLEFPNVFVAGVCKGLLPFNEDQQNEERRLLYVAMTRAQNWLCLSSYESNTGSDANGRSPFLDEIPRNLIEPTQLLDAPHIPSKPIKSNGTGSSTVVEEPLESTTLPPIRPEIVLGIDPGKIDANNPNVGWAVTLKSSDGYAVIDYNTETPKGTSDDKLKQIEHRINKLITLYSPDAIAVEKLEGATDEGLSGVAGCVALVRYIANQREIECAFYSPQQVKYAATGNRNADKEQVQEGIKKRCNLSTLQNIDNIDDHSADAIAVSLCYLGSYLNSSHLQWKKRRQEYYESGFVNLSSGQFDAAVIAFTEAINIDPIYREAYYGLGRAHLAQGDLDRAENAAKTALRFAENNHPDSQKVLDAIKHYRLGCHAVNNKQFDKAIVEFRGSINMEHIFPDAHSGLSRAYLGAGNPTAAKDTAEEALRLRDDYPSTRNLLNAITFYNTGLNFLNNQLYDEAIDGFKKAIDRESTFTEAHYQLGYARFQNGALEAAEQSVNDTLKLNTNYQPARTLLDKIKEAYVDTGSEALERLDLSEAEKYRNKALQIDEYYQPAHKLFESIKKAHYKQTCNYLNNKQYDYAISEFNKLINKDPNFIDAYCGLGRAYLEKGNLRDAENYANTALKLDENYQPVLELLEDIRQAYYNRGRDHLDNRRYDEAIAAFKETINKYSSFIEAYCGLARAYLGKGNVVMAGRSVRSAYELDPNSRPVLQLMEAIKERHCEIGTDDLNQGNLSAAEESVNEALRLDPNDPHYQPAQDLLNAIKQIYYNRGSTYLKQGDWDAAADSARNALRLDKNYLPARELRETIRKLYYDQGLDYIADRAFDKAVKSLQKAKDIDPNDKAVWSNLGLAYYWIDEYANAARCYRNVTDLDPKDKNAYSNLGNAYFWMGEYADAIEPLQKACAIDPNCEKFHYYLGRAQFELDRLEEAKRAAEKALEINPNYQPTSELLKKIKKRSHKIIRRNNPNMILIPAGEFQMGCDDRDAPTNEKPIHTVYLDDFYIDKYPVTNVEYKKFVDANPLWRKDSVSRKYHNGGYLKHWNGNNYPSGKANHPVVYVSWYAAIAYAQWVGKRLPTEAEWEKAARGDLVSQIYPWGNLIDPSKANYSRNVKQTTLVDDYPANNYGLYDMAGNVWEWCLDRYNEDFYVKSSCRNPFAGGTLKHVIDFFRNVKNPRVLRGGSWSVEPQDVRSSARTWKSPDTPCPDLGFRCVMTVTP